MKRFLVSWYELPLDPEKKMLDIACDAMLGISGSLFDSKPNTPRHLARVIFAALREQNFEVCLKSGYVLRDDHSINNDFVREVSRWSSGTRQTDGAELMQAVIDAENSEHIIEALGDREIRSISEQVPDWLPAENYRFPGVKSDPQIVLGPASEQ
jgi:hypothetical protein